MGLFIKKPFAALQALSLIHISKPLSLRCGNWQTKKNIKKERGV